MKNYTGQKLLMVAPFKYFFGNEYWFTRLMVFLSSKFPLGLILA